MIKRDSPTSVDCPIRYVFSFDTGEDCRQTLDFSVVAFLKSRVVGVAWYSVLVPPYEYGVRLSGLRGGSRKSEKDAGLGLSGGWAAPFSPVSSSTASVKLLPKKDGMTVLCALRQTDRETKVLILSARSEVEDKVQGLDAGANDYLAKPLAVS